MKLVAFAFSIVRDRSWRKQLPAGILLTLGTTAILLGGCSEDTVQPDFPPEPPPTPNNWLLTVSGFAVNDVYAAGTKGAMFRFDGTSWSQVDLGVSSVITSIWDSEEGDLYACAHDGYLWSNDGDGWSAIDSGTSANLFNVGRYNGDIYACGEAGTIRARNSGWGDPGMNTIVKRHPVSNLPEDTLYVDRDIASFVTVNHYGFAGAYRVPGYEGETTGILGTDGMILSPDTDPTYNWLLRPIKGEQLADSEWVICSTSSSLEIGNNYLGTTEGWIFRLKPAVGGGVSWKPIYPKVTNGPSLGVRDFWMDADANLYFVTDDGQIWFQTADYEFQGTGRRVLLEDLIYPLMGIWGVNPAVDTDPIDLFIVGYMEELILVGSHDQATDVFTFEFQPVSFPDKGMGLTPGVDHLGLPLR